MRTSGIKTPFVKLNKAINIYKYEKQQKELKRLVNIENVDDPSAYGQLFTNREYLATYAKAKGVKFTFNSLPDKKMDIVVEKDVKKAADAATKTSTINANTEELETVERPIERMLENKDGLNYISKCTESQCDNFLGRVYRTLETLIYNLNKK